MGFLSRFRSKPEPSRDARKQRFLDLVKLFNDEDYLAALPVGMELLEGNASFQVLQITLISLQRLESAGHGDADYRPLVKETSELALAATADRPFYNDLIKLTLLRASPEELKPKAQTPVQQAQLLYYTGARAYTDGLYALAEACWNDAFWTAAVSIEYTMAAAGLLNVRKKLGSPADPRHEAALRKIATEELEKLGRAAR